MRMSPSGWPLTRHYYNDEALVNYLPYLLIGFMLLYVLFQMWPLLRAHRMQGRPLPDVTGLLDPGMLERDLLLFYFASPHCYMCRSMTPVIARLAFEYDNIISVDVTEQRELAKKFGVMGTPAFVLVRGGRIERMLVGVKSERRLRALLEEG